MLQPPTQALPTLVAIVTRSLELQRTGQTCFLEACAIVVMPAKLMMRETMG